MSDFDSNPFADPHANPFADQAVRNASQQGQKVETLDEFNPFAEDRFTSKTTANQPAVIDPAPPAYTPPEPQPSYAASEYLQRRQEELERKAAELDRREQAMQQNVLAAARVANFPPLPSKLPIKPCFYQDISVDIPREFQTIVRFNFYFWIAYICALFLNIWVAVAYFAVCASHDVSDNKSGSTLGLSILYFFLWTPASFVCWFRAVYNAFRLDSSFFFFAYFFVFFMQFVANIVQCLGIDGSGTVGWISGLQMIGKSGGAVKSVGLVMIIVGVIFTLLAIFCFLLLVRVHRLYRATGGNFAKAQQEFAQGVVTNRAVQGAAGSLASSAVQGAAQNTFSSSHDPRY